MLYSRRLTRCGFCGAVIPDALRFSAEEIAALDQSVAESAARRREHERDADERDAAKRRADSNESCVYLGP